MKNAFGWLYAVLYCSLALCIGGFVGAVAGVGISGLVRRPEEATVFVTGITIGTPVGALAGLVLGIGAVARRHRSIGAD